MTSPTRGKATRRLNALLLAAASVLAACADRDPSASPRVGESPAAVESSSPSSDVPKILDFTAPKLGGGQVVGAEFAGKDVVVWFWAPW